MAARNNLEASPEIYQIKVTLLGTNPPIWRRLLVPADCTLKQLHEILQVAMGWENDHLHEFRIGKQSFAKPNPMEAAFGGPRSINEATVRLFEVFAGTQKKGIYTYDFGDSWEHEIKVEKGLAREAGRTYPECVAGERHGPPEDCGGIPGFYNLLDAISDPNHAAHDEMVDWLGGDFDPEAFSLEEINKNLKKLKLRAKKAGGAIN